jgi:hypothetical protein
MLALALTSVAVDRRDGNLAAEQEVVQYVGIPLRLDKHECQALQLLELGAELPPFLAIWDPQAAL